MRRGLSLIELVVSLGISAALLLAVAPLMPQWTRGAQTVDARAKLAQAYSTAKALALRNPLGVAETDASNNPVAAAGVRVELSGTNHLLFACTGSPTAATCGASGANVVWRADFPSTVAIVLAGTTVATGTPATVTLNNRGVPGGSTTYTISRGGSANDETGTLQ